MENDSRNILKFIICFHFQVMPLESIDYVTLHDLLLTYIVTLYHITQGSYILVIVSFKVQ